jgi:hypothetical protein
MEIMGQVELSETAQGDWGRVARYYLEEMQKKHFRKLKKNGELNAVLNEAASVGLSEFEFHLQQGSPGYIASEYGREAVFSFINSSAEEEE